MKPENQNILDYEAIGRRIRAERMTRGLTTRDLSELSHVDMHTISNYERGTKRIGLTVGVQIARALDMSLEYMLFGRSADGLDENEIGLIEKYRSLDDKGKENLLNISKVVK